MRRRIEIVARERERISTRLTFNCPICLSNTQLLTPQQAGELLQVGTESVLEWLSEGKIHGVITPGGQPRICRRSLCYSMDPLIP